jgi:hypothetical protein
MLSTREIIGRLQQLQRDLDERLIISWLQNKREKPQDIADTVALMAQVADILNGEIDLFIGMLGATQEEELARSSGLDSELVDLQAESDTNRPLDGLIS